MTLADLAGYKVTSRIATPYTTTSDYTTRPICVPYRVYIVCSNNVPSGGIALLQGLRIAEKQPFDRWGVHDPRAWAALIETERLMYADRDQYEGDTKQFTALESGYLDDGYATARAATITPGTVSATPKAGTLPSIMAGATGKDRTLEPGGTSHFVIRDSYGNVLSMTTTVESFFGTGRMVGGFFLNNQLTDFSFSPVAADGTAVANAVAAGKHPRSSMAPLIVFDKTGKTVIAAVGSPGGSSILGYNLKTLIALLDWHLPMQAAIDLPNVVARGDSIRIEQGPMEPAVWDALGAMGYKLTPLTGEESGLNGFIRNDDGTFNGGIRQTPRRGVHDRQQSEMKNIVILTGAGISAESGVPTFRASDGLWCGHRVEEVATPEGFTRNPDLVQTFYNDRRRQLHDVAPNAAHLALARLAAEWPGEVLLVTQNVDDLHDRAHITLPPSDGFGLIHMHGELLKARCTETDAVCTWTADILPDTVSPFHADATLRPHIVWFGEMPLEMERIERSLRQADLFISIGTSGNVYPAAGFVAMADRYGAHTVELNLEPSLGQNQFAERHYGPATRVVPAFVETLLQA